MTTRRTLGILAATALLTLGVGGCDAQGADPGGGQVVAPGGSAELRTSRSAVTVSVRSVVCGAEATADITAKVEYNLDRFGVDDSDSVRRLPAGSQFCVVTLDVTNSGNEAVVWSLHGQRGSLNVGDVKYQSLGVAMELNQPYYQWAHAEGMPNASFGMNPGESGPDFTVYVIPADATPTGVQVGDTLFQLP